MQHITGAYVALAIALNKLIREKEASPRALKSAVAAVSVGIVGREALLDLNYAEDSRAEVDFNVVMNSNGEFVEVHGATFSRAQMNELLKLAKKGIEELLAPRRFYSVGVGVAVGVIIGVRVGLCFGLGIRVGVGA